MTTKHENESHQRKNSDFAEIGTTGLPIYAGRVDTEFLNELRGKKFYKAFTELSRNNAIIGGILSALEFPIYEAGFYFECHPLNDTPEQRQLCTFLESVFYDLEKSWQHTLSEILSALVYGQSLMVVQLKHRIEGDSRFPDGLIGLKSFDLRSQDTIERWKVTSTGEIVGAYQQAPGLKEVFIPIPARGILFRFRADANNPLGKSLLRNAFTSYAQYKRYEDLLAIGVERQLVGLPVLTVGTADNPLDIWNDNDPDASTLRARCEDLVRNLRTDQHSGIVLPPSMKLDFLSSDMKKKAEDLLKVEHRLASAMARSVMAQFLVTGSSSTGTYALGTIQQDLLRRTIEGITATVADEINRQLVPRLLRANGFSAFRHPIMKFRSIRLIDFRELGAFLDRSVAAGIFTPTEKDEDYFRHILGMPPLSESERAERERKPTTEKEVVEAEAVP